MNNPIYALASTICEKFIEADPKAAAHALESLATHEVLVLTGHLKAQTLIAVLNPMAAPKAAAVLRRLPFKQACYVFTRLDVEQGNKIWKEFSAPYQERLKSELPESFIKLISGSAQYAPGSVAKWINTDCVLVKTDAKISTLVERLKALPRKKLPAVCFVTGKENELKGLIRSGEIAFYDAQSVCGSVMSAAPCVHPATSTQEALALAEREQLPLLPVTDEHNKVLGVVAQEVLLREGKEKSLWERLTK